MIYFSYEMSYIPNDAGETVDQEKISEQEHRVDISCPALGGSVGCNALFDRFRVNLRLLADDILEGFPDSAILRIDIVLFCFFPYIEWLPLS